MKPLSTDLSIALAEIGRDVSGMGARRIADTLQGCEEAHDLEVRLDALPAPNLRSLANDLVQVWRKHRDVDGRAVALALVAAHEAAEAERRAETIQLVWTGPKTPQVPVARNDEALLDLAARARRELLLVSYATYQVPRVVERMAEAAARGVSVDIVLEFYGADGKIDSYDPVEGLGATLHPQIDIWQWPPGVRPKSDKGRMGYLHVKCAVADAEVAFVSSANLTAHAMERNMELGVLIRGGSVPRRISAHFRELMRRGTLERVSDARV